MALDLRRWIHIARHFPCNKYQVEAPCILIPKTKLHYELLDALSLGFKLRKAT